MNILGTAAKCLVFLFVYVFILPRVVRWKALNLQNRQSNFMAGAAIVTVIILLTIFLASQGIFDDPIGIWAIIGCWILFGIPAYIHILRGCRLPRGTTIPKTYVKKLIAHSERPLITRVADALSGSSDHAMPDELQTWVSMETIFQMGKALPATFTPRENPYEWIEHEEDILVGLGIGLGILWGSLPIVFLILVLISLPAWIDPVCWSITPPFLLLFGILEAYLLKISYSNLKMAFIAQRTQHRLWQEWVHKSDARH